MTTAPAPQNVPPVLMPWPAEHYGCRVVELGEDGGLYAVAGPARHEHVPARRAVAAVLHWLRVDCGYSREDLRDVFGEDCKVEPRWVTPIDDDDEPWDWADFQTPEAWAVACVEGYL